MLPPDCEAALAELDSFRRGTLPPEKLAVMQRHLDSCRECLAAKTREDAFLDRLSNAARECVCPEELRASIVAMIANGSHGS